VEAAEDENGLSSPFLRKCGGIADMCGVWPLNGYEEHNARSMRELGRDGLYLVGELVSLRWLGCSIV
jgi:hypothetical protein